MFGGEEGIRLIKVLPGPYPGKQQSTGLLHLMVRIPLTEIISAHHPVGGYYLSMGYKKDIFAVFAYEFELLRCAKVPIVAVISYH